MKAQSQSRDRQTAGRLSCLCFRDANLHEQVGRPAGLGMQVRIAGVWKHGAIRGLSWEQSINYSLKAETGRLLAG